MSTCRANDRSTALRTLEDHLQDGTAWRKFEQMVESQGGRLDEGLRIAPDQEVLAGGGGIVTAIDALPVAHALAALGGSRQRMDDSIDLSVGVELLVRSGDEVRRGQPVARIFAHERGANEATSMVLGAIHVGQERPIRAEPILERIAP
jgi:thymidine phosphorylase